MYTYIYIYIYIYVYTYVYLYRKLICGEVTRSYIYSKAAQFRLSAESYRLRWTRVGAVCVRIGLTGRWDYNSRTWIPNYIKFQKYLPKK